MREMLLKHIAAGNGLWQRKPGRQPEDAGNLLV
jgi:hypothetical protein